MKPVRRFSVYWFDPGVAEGAEIRKIRPCIVISPNEMNDNLRTVLIVPLTSTIQGWPFRSTVTIMGQKSSAACDQLRAVDKTRLKARIGALKPSEVHKLQDVLRSILAD